MVRLSFALTSVLLASSAVAQIPDATEWKWSAGNLSLEASIETYTSFYAMSGTWWNLAAVSAPSFDMQRNFTEFWVQPSLKASYPLGDNAEIYGALGVGASQTLGADAYDYEDEGGVRFGSAVLGIRGADDGWQYDLSYGRQPYTLGTGMLLYAGSSNGYTWGGGASAQRKVWGSSAIASLGHGEWTGTAFVLEPDEAAAARTDTRVQGIALEWKRPEIGKAGLAWLTVPRSDAIYPGDLAPLYYIEQGREGLDTWHAWADLSGMIPGVPEFGIRAEYADQRNTITRADGSRDPMRADAWMLGASWWAQKARFAPKFSYHYARFSGDDPDTATYERFDPLFWGNGLNHWWFGANGAYSWLNANLRAHRFIVDAYFTSADIVQIQYVKASADELNSAIQFGQGVRFTDNQLLVGVPTPELSDEIYLQYSRVFNPKLVLTAFLSRSSPGDGLEATAPQELKPWTTFGLGLTANF